MLGNKPFKIVYLQDVIENDIPILPPTMRLRIRSAIEERIATDPISFGKPLRYSLKEHRRLRVGDYRIVYRIEAEHSRVIIVAIKHRKIIYDY
jgi:mRNA-degrading endonuclease RelE of RelBE toxin-antitoxin system